ncbi:hypothetical protein B0A54_17581 [Friedmanniomyces endolithicus]|uniref:Uncharacterized protein n=1 Tax=Friedmanniomyces endolithicus TaxID=329885 RepID=A0A4U0TU10_9PEZI|nr:hypothetical protein B0A54_17581 [Friedmanniomyces endolithicus]
MAAFPALQSTTGAHLSKDQADKSPHSDEHEIHQRNKTADKCYAIIHGYPGYYTPLMRRVLAEDLSLEQANHKVMSWAFGERSIIPHKTVADLYFGERARVHGTSIVSAAQPRCDLDSMARYEWPPGRLNVPMHGVYSSSWNVQT